MQDQNHLALKEVELSRLSAVISILQDTSHYHSSTFADLDIKLLDNVLRNWPVGMIFPGLAFFFLIDDILVARYTSKRNDL